MHSHKLLIYISIVSVILTLALPFYTQRVNAQTPNDGIIIHADRVEGVLSLPSLQDGETPSKKHQLMLRLTYKSVDIYGLTIYKTYTTSDKLLTVKMTSNDSVHIENMAVDVTHLEFGSLYISKNGQLGLKDVVLVAHHQTGDDMSLPGLTVSFTDEMPGEYPTDSEAMLNEQLSTLKTLLDDLSDGHLDQSALKDANLSYPTQKEETPKDANEEQNHNQDTTSETTEEDSEPSSPAQDNTDTANSDTSSDQEEEPPTPEIPIDGESNADQTIQVLEKLQTLLEDQLTTFDHTVDTLNQSLQVVKNVLDTYNDPILGLIFHITERDKAITNLDEAFMEAKISLDQSAFEREIIQPLTELKSIPSIEHESQIKASIKETLDQANNLLTQENQLGQFITDAQAEIHQHKNKVIDLLNDFLTQDMKELTD